MLSHSGKSEGDPASGVRPQTTGSEADASAGPVVGSVDHREELEPVSWAALAARLGVEIEKGLSSSEARNRAERIGPNAVPGVRIQWYRRLALQFWGATAWMLEATVVLAAVLGRFVDAGIVAALLLFNGIL